MEKENKLTNGMKHLIVMIGIAVLLMFAGILKVEAAPIKNDTTQSYYLEYWVDWGNRVDFSKERFNTDVRMAVYKQEGYYAVYLYDISGGKTVTITKEVTEKYLEYYHSINDDSPYYTDDYNGELPKVNSNSAYNNLYYAINNDAVEPKMFDVNTNMPIFTDITKMVEYFETGYIEPEESENYDSTLPNIQNLVYKSISPKECHGKNTIDCVTCFNLSWKVPVDKTESDIYQVKMYVKYSYTTTDSNSLQYKTEMIDISNCSGTFLVGEGTQDICAQDIKENLNINNLSTFDIHTIYKIYVRTMRTTSDHVSHYGNWTEFTMNKGILNNTSVGESVEVPGDTDINDDGTIDRELKGVIYLNDFYLKNVSVGKMDILGRRNISWTSTTRDADVLLVPDSDTIVVASFMVVNNDEESSTTQNEYKTVTIGSCGFQFLIEDIFEITDNQDCKWDGKLRLCPMYYSNGYLYVGELTVIDVLNDKVTNEGLDDEGNLKQEDVTPDATIDNNTIVNYTNTFLSYLKTLVSQIGELPSLFAVVFAFIPGIYLNVIGIIFIIILILRVLGR